MASACIAGTVRVWDIARKYEPISLKGHTSEVSRVAFSANGLLASADAAGFVILWDVFSGQEVVNVRSYGGGFTGVAFEPVSGQLISPGFDGVVRRWDLSSREEVTKFKSHTEGILAIALTTDGRRLATSGSDGTGKLWDLTTSKELLTLREIGHTIASLAISPNGRRIASAGRDGTLVLWDTNSGQKQLSCKGQAAPGFISSVVFSPDGRRVAYASGDGEIRVWDSNSGEVLQILRMGSGRSLAYSPDGRHLAYAIENGSLRISDALSGQEILTLKGHSGVVQDVVFSSDGSRIASAGSNGDVKIWDPHSGHDLLTLKGQTAGDEILNVIRLAFSPDGQKLGFCSLSGKLKVWETVLPSAEVRRARKSYALVDSLFQEGNTKSEVLDYLRRDTNLTGPQRQLALNQAVRYVHDPTLLNSPSWEVVRLPGKPTAAYERALVQALEACRLEPTQAAFLNTLGLAYYRARKYELALEALTKSDKIYFKDFGSSLPEDLAFPAMAHRQLGHENEAQACLTRLREVMKNSNWAKNEGAQAFLREAEALLSGKPPSVIAPMK